ncbi:MAG: hypothetical protein OEQ53_15815, partial [Saprospiraceae bacterium]|nr:hypothetical protein [Saprospiraceae bacterium]
MPRPTTLAGALALGILLIGCYEKKEGCLDALASNFDVTADLDCCCSYPQLILDVKHVYDSVNLNLGDVYTNQHLQVFRLLSFAFYVSDVQLRKADKWTSVSNQVEFSDNSGQLHSESDDVTIISRQTFRFNIGTFIESGSYEQIRFTVGLVPPESNVNPITIDDEHALSSANNELWNNESGHCAYRFELVDTTTSDTLLWKVPAQDGALEFIEL